MASNLLKKRALQQAEKIDEEYGKDAYGGSNTLRVPKASPVFTDTVIEPSAGKASDFLAGRARASASGVANKYGADAYGATLAGAKAAEEKPVQTVVRRNIPTETVDTGGPGPSAVTLLAQKQQSDEALRKAKLQSGVDSTVARWAGREAAMNGNTAPTTNAAWSGREAAVGGGTVDPQVKAAQTRADQTGQIYDSVVAPVKTEVADLKRQRDAVSAEKLRVDQELRRYTEGGAMDNQRYQELQARSRALEEEFYSLRDAVIDRQIEGTGTLDAGTRVDAAARSIGGSMKATPGVLWETGKQAGKNIAAEWNDEERGDWRQELYNLASEMLEAEYQYGADSLEYQTIVDQMTAIEARLAETDSRTNAPVNTELPRMQAMTRAKELGQQSMTGLTDTGQFLMSTGMSVAQNAALMPLGLVNPGIPLTAMAAISGADKMHELSSRGIGAEQAFVRGVAAGGIEALTEKIPLDNVLDVIKTGGGKSVIANILRQAGLEATEEGIAYAANWMADKAAGDAEDFSLSELLESAAAGGLSGLFFGAGGSVVNKAVNYTPRAKADTAIYDQYAEAGRAGLTFEQVQEVTDAYQGTYDQPEAYKAWALAYNEGGREAQAAYFGKDAGLVKDDNLKKMKMTRAEERQLDALAKVTGTKIVFAPELANAEGRPANASYKDGVITISAQTKNPVQVAALHEAVHRLAETDAEWLGAMTDLTYSTLEQYAPGQWQESLEKRRQKYGEDASDGLVMEETVADALSYILEDSALLERFVTDDRSAARKFVDAIHDIIVRIQRAVGKRELRLRDEDRAEFQTLESRLKLYEDSLEAALRKAETQAGAAAQGDGSARYSLLSYDDRQKDNWGSSKSITLYDGAESLNQFVDDAVEKRNLGKKMYFGKVPGDLATRILHDTGIDVSEYNVALSAYEVRKILESHGSEAKEAARGQRPITKEDFHKIVDIIQAPDSITLGDTTYEGNPVIEFRKIIDGTETVITYSSRKHHDLRVQTMYAGKAKGSLATATDANAPVITSETTAGTASYEHSIPDSGEKINGDQFSLSENENGADTELRLLGLQLPSRVTEYDPTDSIAGIDQNGKTGVKFSLEDDAQEYADRKQYKELVQKYGAIPRGENPARDVMVPRQTTAEDRVRQYIRTVMESGAIPDDMLPSFEQKIVDGEFSYEPISDKSAWGAAQRTVETMGDEKALAQWNAVVNGETVATKDHIALGEYLLSMAAKAGDVETAMRLTAEIAAEGTRAGQTVQAMRLLKGMTGAGQLYYVNKTVDNLQKDLIKKYGAKAPTIEIPADLAQQLMQAVSSAEIEAINDKLLTAVAAQMPTSWTDKWNAWRYLAMLGNPRTHIRNIVGNAVFVPGVTMKNILKAGMEGAVDMASKAAGGPGIQRTASVIGALPGTGGKYRTFAVNDFAQMKDIVSGGGKMNPSDVIRDRQRIFKTKALETARKWNYNLLELEDAVFLKYHYVRAMTQYLMANKTDLSTLSEGTREGNRALEKARIHALNEAQRATYRDASAFATALSKFSRSNKAANLLVEGIMPFKKTPVNILKRGLEYSPLGLIESMSRGIYQLKQGKITTNDFLDKLARGMTGAGVVGLGMFLGSLGMLSGGMGDDKEDKFDKLQGEQEYALNIGDTSYTIDWAAPLSLPLFVGAEIWNEMQQENHELTFSDVADVLGLITEPMFNLSMLDGLNRTLSAGGYSDNPLSNVAAEVVAGYFGQAVPTVLGQFARTIDNTRRRSYVDKNVNVPGNMQYFAQKNLNKLPGASMRSQPYIDAWGREEVNDNVAMRAFENFLSPGFISQRETSDMERELWRLYEETGETKVLPADAPKYFMANKERVDLTAEEYTRFARTKGQTAHDLLTSMTGSNTYSRLPDETKKAVVISAHDYASAIAKMEAAPEYQPDKWVVKAKNAPRQLGITTEQYLILRQSEGSGYLGQDGAYDAYDAGISPQKYVSFRTALKEIAGDNISQAEMTEALEQTAFTKDQKAALWEIVGVKGWKSNP